VAPDLFKEAHLVTHLKVFIGGAKPVSVGCDLSKKHSVADVIKHVLTTVRKDKDMKGRVEFECPITEPYGFELRHIDDDSDSEDEYPGIYYRPLLDLPPLGENQQIGEFDALVLIQKKNWRQAVEARSVR